MATGAKLRAKKGLREITRLSRIAGSPSVLVGILAGAGTHPKSGSATLAEVAFWNEYGTTRIPPRPFLRRTIQECNYYKREFGAALAAYLRGESSGVSLLSVIGMRAATDVKATITAIMTPENAESTRKAKASKSHVAADEINNPLIDTGAMRAAVNYEVRNV